MPLRRSNRPYRWSKKALIASVLAISAIPASDQPTEHLVQQQISAGQIALLVRQGGSPQAVEILRRGLRDERAEIRAAAGRVINASRAAVPLDDLRKALLVETDFAAAREEAGALVGSSGPEVTAPLLEAGIRLGGGMPGVMALLLARARGPADVAAFISDLTALSISSEKRTACILVATRHDVAALNSVGTSALAANDSDTWLAVLDGAAQADAELEGTLLVSALRHPMPKIAGETAWRLAKVFSRRPRGDAMALRGSLEGAAGSQNAIEDADLRFGMELLARALGREPIENGAWIEFLRTAEGSRMDLPDNQGPLAALLTTPEFRALRKHLVDRYPGTPLAEPRNDRATSWQGPPKRALRVPPTVRLASAFPPKFVSETLAASGCVLSAQPLVGEASVTYDPLGRATKIVLRHVPPARECTEAMTALFAASVEPMTSVVDPKTPETLILVLENGYLSRLEEDLTQSEATYLSPSAKVKIEPPARTRFVKPDYPVEARRARIEARVIAEVVVNEDGLVSDMRLLKEAKEDFVRSAFVAVAQWRYRPGLIGGRPVRLYLTVIVDWDVH